MSIEFKILSACGKVAARSADGGGCQKAPLPGAPLHRIAVPLPVNGEGGRFPPVYGGIMGGV